ncbi:mitogen-activated protein kinase 8-like isoform X2 [Zea mays]|nr:mitogen-activated protein kinase 8-like isoform X2 [Zea mays]XP_020397894.1 mitogen-activated protein kinase 8-like isoform X2 [Zea mays]XP_035817453.1 mitogen-activated protein kinase 8-like isoform X2 [Zea mays]AQK97124.1 Mitogen-activated protein kinase 20 [Zea mays]AQK97125.1 Mitogen-activated protein kinase 20 [Zea mays]AQK97126.1 Mitogen-activated protein kinase 20 [Zea mays]AQK97127.1 Mitogen-activated protein kinase 20 [Zea mays]|eukprot:XP_008656723.1 mitogen-activated protein kinase 8-like isoform X2 [Zea mays]
MDFFSEYGDANRYKIQEVIGKGSYGVVCSAVDQHTGDKVAIKKIHNIFEHLSDAARILREIKLLRLLRHPDIVEIKHIMLPPSRRDFKDIYVVFELMDTDLHQVIKANDDLTREHHQFFLYQMLRALKYIHTANVYHRDLKPKNILANANCKLKICDFGLARVAFNDTPTTVFWTDYVATRWYRAPELCGSFFSKYSPAIDIWSIGCIFAEVLTGKPLFPGKNVVHQLDLMTDLLGTPSLDTVSRIRNEKARRYLNSMRKKQPVSFPGRFPKADPAALKLLQRLLAFDPKDRPTPEEALADPYFKGLAKVEREPSCQPITKMEFEFERRKVTKEDVKELIFREILEYHPQLLKDYMNGTEKTNFIYPSAVDNFRRQFANLEENGGKSVAHTASSDRKHVSLPRTTTVHSNPIPPNGTSQVPRKIPTGRPGRVVGSVIPFENATAVDPYSQRRVVRNPVLPPATSNLSAYTYHRKSDNSDGELQQELEKDRMKYQPAQRFMDSKLVSHMSPDLRSSYYIPKAFPKADAADRAALHSNMIHGIAPFSGIAAAGGGGYNKVNGVQYGVSRIY